MEMRGPRGAYPVSKGLSGHQPQRGASPVHPPVHRWAGLMWPRSLFFSELSGRRPSTSSRRLCLQLLLRPGLLLCLEKGLNPGSPWHPGREMEGASCPTLPSQDASVAAASLSVCLYLLLFVCHLSIIDPSSIASLSSMFLSTICLLSLFIICFLPVYLLIVSLTACPVLEGGGVGRPWIPLRSRSPV